MQWVFLALTTLWIFTVVIATILLFWHTSNALCFSLFSTLAPPVYIWWRITKYLFPQDDRDYQLKLARIKVKYVTKRSNQKHDSPTNP